MLILLDALNIKMMLIPVSYSLASAFFALLLLYIFTRNKSFIQVKFIPVIISFTVCLAILTFISILFSSNKTGLYLHDVNNGWTNVALLSVPFIIAVSTSFYAIQRSKVRAKKLQQQQERGN